MGTVTVRPDSVQIGNYTLINCAIESIRELSFNGTDAGYVVTIKGYYTINNAL